MAERDIIYRIGDQEYGFDVQMVTAIEPMMEIVPVPNGPACVLGLMNLRGEVIPVYSLRKKFSLEDQSELKKTKLIVTRYDDTSIAFVVDEVLEMCDFTDDLITETPLIAKSAQTAYVRAVANKQGKLVLLLNPAMMYEGDEAEQMAEVIRRMKGEGDKEEEKEEE